MTTSYLNPDQIGPAPSARQDQPGPIATLWRRRGLFATVFAAVLALAVLAFLVSPVQYLAVGSVIVAGLRLPERG